MSEDRIRFTMTKDIAEYINSHKPDGETLASFIRYLIRLGIHENKKLHGELEENLITLNYEFTNIPKDI